MGSLIEELRRREAAARAGADQLRTRTEELTEDLARTEEQVTWLAIAREEVTRVLEEPAAAVPSAGQASPIGAVAVPPRQDGADASVLDRLEELQETVRRRPGHRGVGTGNDQRLGGGRLISQPATAAPTYYDTSAATEQRPLDNRCAGTPKMKIDSAGES